jgi:hypothetical protein
VRETGATPEGSLRLEVCERGDHRPVVPRGGLPLVLEDAPALGFGEDDIRPPLEAAGGCGLEEVDLAPPCPGDDGEEAVEAAGLQELPGGDRDDVGVETLPRRGTEGGQGGTERSRPAAKPVVLCFVVGVEAYAYGEEAAAAQRARARRRQAVARRVEHEAGSLVEAPHDVLEVVAEERFSPRDRDLDCAQGLQLGGDIPQRGDREVFLAPPGVVAMPAPVAAPVRDGERHRVEPTRRARPAHVEELLDERLEGAAGVGREVAVDHGAAAEGDGLLVGEVVLEEDRQPRVESGERRPSGQHSEELVAPHGRVDSGESSPGRSRMPTHPSGFSSRAGDPQTAPGAGPCYTDPALHGMLPWRT